MLDVEPGGWLWKDARVRMTATSLVGAGHGGMVGALSNMMTGDTVALNRFIGPGRIGIPSMTYVPGELREATGPRGSATAVFGRGGNWRSLAGPVFPLLRVPGD